MKKRYWLTLILISLLFCGVYAALFYLMNGFLTAQFEASAPDLLGLKNFGMVHGGNTQEIFEEFGALIGIGIGLSTLSFSFMLWGLLAIIKLGKNNYAKLINLLISYGILLAFGAEFVYLEERTTALSRAVIVYVGYPLLYASIVTIIVIIIIGLVSILKKVPKGAKAMMLLLALSLPSLSGCLILSDITAFTCSFGVDDSHCYQESAIQKNDPEACEKVAQPEEFKKAGTNPPKDKCFMVVAENKEDPTICNRIQGGMFSYEKSDCVQEIAIGTKNYDTCKLGATDVTACVQGIINEDQKELTKLAEDVKNSPTPDMDKVAEMEILMTKMSQFYSTMTEIQKINYEMSMSSVKNLR